MFDPGIWIGALPAMLSVALLFWLLSVKLADVSIVDILWGPFFLLAALAYALANPAETPREALVLAMVAIWSLRLAAHIAVRSHGHGEDRRYQAIRARNEPGFRWKSLYIVFALQAGLAWIISLPLLGATLSPAPLGWLDAIGVTLWLVGFSVETVADGQLQRFRNRPDSAGKVLDTGLWRYSRHPNYFGECLLWWGFYLIALSAGAWWSVPGPLLMTLFLLRVSGVTLLESDIAERRPAYREYQRRTSAFLPLPRRTS